MQHSRPETAAKRKIALVQGESFRCVAVEVESGHWRQVKNGIELPRVLNIIRIMGYCEPSFFASIR